MQERTLKTILYEKWSKILETALEDEQYEICAKVKQILDKLKSSGSELLCNSCGATINYSDRVYKDSLHCGIIQKTATCPFCGGQKCLQDLT